ncbi:beta-hydroxyacyl-ACP dehydratase [Trinickia violacea]|uniref:Beta-hydroxyacyl-ACP dehydratase n=1 Tax=Trinickia violacea TaxID=2571746 RepID=A0A4P8IM76_9BURK|nr:AMP-binding protein [Trinickia violacea]QCP48897.1 beta-hydroxyacyl-ACP dehydratase [Trinickia violacea]
MPSFPLVSHSSLDEPIAWRDGAPVSVRAFLADVARLAAALPPGGHVFNACKDRYRFAVGFCAALVAGKVTLLPSTHTQESLRQLASFAPDTFCLHDSNEGAIGLPGFRFPELERAAPDASGAAAAVHEAVPRIEASRVAAYLFTSGSTGTPVPHRKTWGALVKSVRAGLEPLGLAGAHGATLVGTVPPQHMYGFEHTILLALIGALAFSNRQPFYPADIRLALEAVPEPRVLVTSPVHLRALLMSESTHRPHTSLILSATAPLQTTLAAEAEARLAAPLMEIYGSTETGKIATRRTALGDVWQLVPEVALQARGGTQDDDAEIWAAGGHIEAPAPMGDVLERLDESHFLLHGRKADLINIAGKRTSLGYLNHQLNAIPGVTDGVFFMPDNSAHADDEGHEAHEKVTRLAAFVVAPALLAAELQRALRERIDAAFMPRPLLFVDALPRNEAGKLPREALVALAAQHARRAAKSAAPHAAHEAQPLTFDIPLDHPALPGHFPGQPIVPGVMLLDHAISGIGRALERPLHAFKIRSAKFPNSATPGVPFELTYRTDDNGAIQFAVTVGARTVATGVLSEREAAA